MSLFFWKVLSNRKIQFISQPKKPVIKMCLSHIFSLSFVKTETRMHISKLSGKTFVSKGYGNVTSTWLLHFDCLKY